jgi:hypothetical protein
VRGNESNAETPGKCKAGSWQATCQCSLCGLRQVWSAGCCCFFLVGEELTESLAEMWLN